MSIESSRRASRSSAQISAEQMARLRSLADSAQVKTSWFHRFKQSVKNSNGLQLVSVPYMRKLTFLAVLIYSCSMSAYMGTAYNITKLPGKVFEPVNLLKVARKSLLQ